MLLEMVAARDTARPLPDDRMTVGKWLVLWLKRQEARQLRPNTIKAYTRSVRLLLPELGSIPIRRLRSGQVEAAIAQLPGATATGARTVLSTAVKDAMRDGHVITNEAALARPPKAGRRGLPAPDVETVRAVLRDLEPHRLHALFVLLAGTGLRIGEATGLRWPDVADDRLTVTYQVTRVDRVNRGANEPKTELVHSDPKTDTAGRVAFLPPSLQAALRSHKARQAAERLAAGRKWRVADLVFTTAEGEPVAESTAQWILAQACKRARVRHVRPHDLRRFALTQVEERLGREAAQRMGGHADPKTTELYVTTTNRMLADAAAVLEEAIG